MFAYTLPPHRIIILLVIFVLIGYLIREMVKISMQMAADRRLPFGVPNSGLNHEETLLVELLKLTEQRKKNGNNFRDHWHLSLGTHHDDEVVLFDRSPKGKTVTPRHLRIDTRILMAGVKDPLSEITPIKDGLGRVIGYVPPKIKPSDDGEGFDW
ncbi:FeoB-associated Cys-rich membrane protein [Candidatus Saccharibacteria bacterium]|jgi:hypothetical protein|nr:FeoB-associated Cys-rich membrane protein [Candidatus Saccharibacteria bacterium]MBP9132281.1 FeoB-associated Cys-rich membrane protein [Candidatus Saccharibacteria bacterium]